MDGYRHDAPAASASMSAATIITLWVVFGLHGRLLRPFCRGDLAITSHCSWM
jgi:hypothetical protein